MHASTMIEEVNVIMSYPNKMHAYLMYFQSAVNYVSIVTFLDYFFNLYLPSIYKTPVSLEIHAKTLRRWLPQNEFSQPNIYFDPGWPR
jgi:hypothetical protein